ncbi:MAG: hypothetical protein PHI37_00910 [Candidatus Gracilibacteria bacterium]|nr:hypothetical protein [Candidatus Gracilibacteria bacterium]
MEKCPFSHHLITNAGEAIDEASSGFKKFTNRLIGKEKTNTLDLLVENENMLLNIFEKVRELEIQSIESIFGEFKDRVNFYNKYNLTLLYSIALLLESGLIEERQLVNLPLDSKTIYNIITSGFNPKKQEIKSRFGQIIDTKTSKNFSEEELEIINFFVKSFIPKVKKLCKSRYAWDMFYAGRINDFFDERKKDLDYMEDKKRNDTLSFEAGYDLMIFAEENKDLIIEKIRGKQNRNQIIGAFLDIIKPKAKFSRKNQDIYGDGFYTDRGKAILSTGLMDIFSIALLVHANLIKREKGIAILIAGMLGGSTSRLGSINQKIEDFIAGKIINQDINEVLKGTYDIKQGERYTACPFYYSPNRNQVIERVIDLFINEIIPELERNKLPIESGNLSKFYNGQLK